MSTVYNCDIVVFECLEQDCNQLILLLDNIYATYMTFRRLKSDREYAQQIKYYAYNILLAKRKLVFGVLISTKPKPYQPYQQLYPYPYLYPNNSHITTISPLNTNFKYSLPQCKRIQFVRKCQPSSMTPCCSTIDLDSYSNWHDIQEYTVRKLQLDLIWIGTLYKLGTDVKKFNAYMNENENFEVVDVEFWNGFLECLDKRLLNKYYENKYSWAELLEKVKTESYEQIFPSHSDDPHYKYQMKTSSNSIKCYLSIKPIIKLNNYPKSYPNSPYKLSTFPVSRNLNLKMYKLVRYKFTSRLILSGITAHPYTKLLYSRSYFHLIYIYADLYSRYNCFLDYIQLKHPVLHSKLSFPHFIQLDYFVTYVLYRLILSLYSHCSLRYASFYIVSNNHSHTRRSFAVYTV